jgi:NADPH2:quinone reductase
VLVRNEYIGVNFIDTYFRSGLYPRPAFPSGLGEEGAGTVEAVGPGVYVGRLPHHVSSIAFIK